MYALLPWKPLSTLLFVIIAATIYVDDLLDLIGVMVPDTMIIRYFPAALAVVFTVLFIPTGYWAPWRFVWRMVPILNSYVFPDLNGIWVAKTSSNSPMIKALVDAATSTKQITVDELRAIPKRHDTMVVQITNNLFDLRMDAIQCSNNDFFNTIIAIPRRQQNENWIRISLVYQYTTLADEGYLGAAELRLVDDNFSVAQGKYWTRQKWLAGGNTDGTLHLERKHARMGIGKNLLKYAEEYCPNKRPPGGNGGPRRTSVADQLLKLLWPFQQDVEDDRQGSSQDDPSLADRLRKLLPF